jgi:hypothetical protein
VVDSLYGEEEGGIGGGGCLEREEGEGGQTKQDTEGGMKAFCEANITGRKRLLSLCTAWVSAKSSSPKRKSRPSELCCNIMMLEHSTWS